MDGSGRYKQNSTNVLNILSSAPNGEIAPAQSSDWHKLGQLLVCSLRDSHAQNFCYYIIEQDPGRC